MVTEITFLKLFKIVLVHESMRNYKSEIEEETNAAVGHWDVNELIELFVELNFNDIYNETLLMQFRIVAQNVGYPTSMIDRVIKLGRSEYSKLMEEVNKAKTENSLDLSGVGF